MNPTTTQDQTSEGWLPWPSMWLALALFLGACVGDSLPPPDITPIEAAESYQLSMDRVELRRVPAGFPLDESQAARALRDTEMRVDFRIVEGALHAVISPAFGEPREYRQAEIVRDADGDTELRLLPRTDPALLAPELPGLAGQAWIRALRLTGRIAENELLWSGEIGIDMTLDALDGDVAWSTEVVARGEGRADDVAPELRLRRFERTPGLLPWEALEVWASEPLDDALLADLVTIDGEEARVEAIASAALDGRFVRATVRPAGWWGGAETTATLAGGIEDAEGNASTEVSYDISRMLVPPAVTRLDFETEATSSANVWGGEWSGAAELPACIEGEGCLRLYREDGTDAGLLAELASTDSATTLRFQLRALFMNELGPLGAPLGLRVQVAASGDRLLAERTEWIAPDAELAAPEGFTGDSGWQQVEIALPASAESLGVVIELFDPSLGAGPLGAAETGPPPVGPIVALIDDVGAGD